MKTVDHRDRLIANLHSQDEYSLEDMTNVKKKGCTTVRPESNQILLDLDSEKDLRLFRAAVEAWERTVTAREGIYISEDLWESKSGKGHYHVRLTFTVGLDRVAYELTQAERVMLQYYFGSDPLKESISTLYYFGTNGGSDTVLFKPEVKDA